MRYRSPEPTGNNGGDYGRSYRDNPNGYYPNNQARSSRSDHNEPRTPKPWWGNKNNQKPRSKSPKKPFWKNKNNQKQPKPPQNRPDQQGGHQYGYQQDYQYHTQEYRDIRDNYPQQHLRAPPQQYHQGSSTHRDYHQYENRRSPIPMHNRYEPLGNYREENDSRSFLEYRRSDRTPPRYEQMTHTRSPNEREDAEADTRSKRRKVQ